MDDFVFLEFPVPLMYNSCIPAHSNNLFVSSILYLAQNANFKTYSLSCGLVVPFIQLLMVLIVKSLFPNRARALAFTENLD